MTLTLFKNTFFFLTCQLHIISLCLQLYKEIEIGTKDTKVIRFDKAESCTIGYGNLESYAVSEFCFKASVCLTV